jgi:hypothetical protein
VRPQMGSRSAAVTGVRRVGRGRRERTRLSPERFRPARHARSVGIAHGMMPLHAIHKRPGEPRAFRVSIRSACGFKSV